MKSITLFTGEIAYVDDEDYAEVSKLKWYRKVSCSGSLYAIANIRENGRPTHIYMHQLIMGRAKGFNIDHINGDPLLNTRANLRVLPVGVNSRAFKKKVPGTSSRYRGVFWEAATSKWRARVEKKREDGSRGIHNVGSFDDEHEAALAYNEAAMSLGFLPEALNAICDCVPSGKAPFRA